MTSKVPLKRIADNRYQARTEYDGIASLAESIAKVGLLQRLMGRVITEPGGPLARWEGEVPVTNAKRFLEEEPESVVELIYGHRRIRACRWMINNPDELPGGLDFDPGAKRIVNERSVDVRIRVLRDTDVYSAVVAENFQNDDLTPIEEARSLKIGREEQGLSNAELAEIHDRSPSWVSNRVRLLRLPERMQQAVIEGEVSTRQAGALLPLYEMSEEETEVAGSAPFEIRPMSIEGATVKGLSSERIRERVTALKEHVEATLNPSLDLETEEEQTEEDELSPPEPEPARTTVDTDETTDTEEWSPDVGTTHPDARDFDREPSGDGAPHDDSPGVPPLEATIAGLEGCDWTWELARSKDGTFDAVVFIIEDGERVGQESIVNADTPEEALSGAFDTARDTAIPF